MIINLQEIPQEGKSWILNRNTGELNEVLRDLIGKTPYQVEFSIRPITTSGESYELTGTIRTELPEQCSRCGLDFNMAVNEKFKNLLMPSLHSPRDAKFAKPNHFSDLHEDGPEVAEYHGNAFDAGEFFHELVALSEPYVPVPPADEKGNCGVCKVPVENQTVSYDSGEIKPANPFAALKGIKLN